MSWSNRKKLGREKDAEANVSTLKVHLGRYLRRVKAGGEVVVLDRQQPVAKIVPFSGEEDPLLEVAPSASWQDFFDLRARNGSGPALMRGFLDYLEEDRG